AVRQRQDTGSIDKGSKPLDLEVNSVFFSARGGHDEMPEETDRWAVRQCTARQQLLEIRGVGNQLQHAVEQRLRAPRLAPHYSKIEENRRRQQVFRRGRTHALSEASTPFIAGKTQLRVA